MRRLAELPRGRFLAAAVVAALAVRLLAFWVWRSAHLDLRFGYDPYVSDAQVLLGLLPPRPILSHPPGFTLWAAGLFLLARGPALWLVRLGNVLLGTAAVGLFALWAEGVLPPVAARLAALGLAFDPLLVFFSPQLESEPLFLVLLALFFLGLGRDGRAPGPKRAFGLGLLGGALTMTRSVVLFYPAFLAGAWALTGGRREWRRWGLAAALLAAGWGVAPALWGLRNEARHGQFIPIATNGGWTLWEGFTTDRQEVRRRPYEMRAEVARLGLDRSPDAFAVSRYYMAKTEAFARAHPLAAARIILVKALLYWRPWVYDPYPVAVRWGTAAYFTLLFLLAAVGGWPLRREAVWAPVWALGLNLTALHAVMFTSLRYRVPLEPFLVCLAAAGAARLLGARR